MNKNYVSYIPNNSFSCWISLPFDLLNDVNASDLKVTAGGNGTLWDSYTPKNVVIKAGEIQWLFLNDILLLS
jgi:hypothetical protein